MIDLVREAVDFAWYEWVLTDPLTCVGRAATADLPGTSTGTELVRLKYLTAERRWTGLARDRVYTAAGDRHHPGGALWEQVLGPSGVTDAMTLALRDPYGCWGFLDLWRTTGSFRREEIGLLTALSPLLTRALRRSVAATFADSPPAFPGPVPADVVLGEDLVLLPTTATTPPLRPLVPTQGADEEITVPTAAVHAAAQLLALEARVDDHDAWTRVHLGHGRWATVGAGRGEGPGVAVAIEATGRADRAELFARANGLSGRESEVLGLLLRGGRTRDLAEAMRVSTHTVQDHLKAVFTKTGTHSRPALVARAFGALP